MAETVSQTWKFRVQRRKKKSLKAKNLNRINRICRMNRISESRIASADWFSTWGRRMKVAGKIDLLG
jgi:hypothetical protein